MARHYSASPGVGNCLGAHASRALPGLRNLTSDVILSTSKQPNKSYETESLSFAIRWPIAATRHAIGANSLWPNISNTKADAVQLSRGLSATAYASLRNY